MSEYVLHVPERIAHTSAFGVVSVCINNVLRNIRGPKVGHLLETAIETGREVDCGTS